MLTIAFPAAAFDTNCYVIATGPGEECVIVDLLDVLAFGEGSDWQDEAMALADRVVVMNQGRIEQQGTPHAVFNAPRTEFVARFMGGHNVFPDATGGLAAVRADKTRLSRRPLPPAPNALPATVRGVEYQGTHVLVTLAGDAVTELIVMLPEADFNAEPWKTGDRTCAHWDGADVHALAA